MSDDDHQSHLLATEKAPAPISSTLFPVDSHCHLKFPDSDKDDAKKGKTLSDLQNITSPFSLICATSPTTDWERLSTLLLSSSSSSSTRSTSSIHVGFGIHPWWSSSAVSVSSQNDSFSATTTWQQTLVKLLEKFPSACVAEIGLDKIRNASTPDEFAKQVEIFETQMDIAASMKRPVSVHCVRAQGPMLELLSKRKEIERYPPAFIFHGFTGSTEFVKSLLKLNKGRGSRFYFGFCSATTGTLKNFSELLQVVPKNRILIESDCFVDVEMCQAQERLVKMAERLEKEGGVSVDDLKQNFLNAVKVG